jgi:hypothetical protein
MSTDSLLPRKHVSTHMLTKDRTSQVLTSVYECNVRKIPVTTTSSTTVVLFCYHHTIES